MGKIGEDLLNEILNHFSNCVIDEFIIMPNHWRLSHKSDFGYKWSDEGV